MTGASETAESAGPVGTAAGTSLSKGKRPVAGVAAAMGTALATARVQVRVVVARAVVAGRGAAVATVVTGEGTALVTGTGMVPATGTGMGASPVPAMGTVTRTVIVTGRRHPSPSTCARSSRRS